MASDSQSELASFHRIVGSVLSGQSANVSPEDALDLWRAEHPAQDERDDATAALKQALDSVAAGEHGIPIEEFERDFRRRHGIDAAK